MESEHTVEVQRFISKYAKTIIVCLSIGAWIWLSYGPVSKQNFLVESRILLLAIPLFLYLGRRYAFTLGTYVSIAFFLLLHLVGAYYGFASVPIGDAVSQITNTPGNHYDKMVHFMFGFLFAYPIRQILKTELQFKRAWFIIPLVVLIILGFSAFYEIWEWLTASNLDPHTAYLFIGGDDPWDSQKDMLVAGIGSLIAITGVYFWNTKKPRG